MKLTRRTFLISSAAAVAYAGLPPLPKVAAIDAGGGRSMTGTIPAGHYAVTATMEFGAAPIEGDIIEFYWGPHGAAAVNSQLIGWLTALPEKTITGYLGRFSPGCEEGQLIVKNGASEPMEAKVEMLEIKYVGGRPGDITIEAGKTVTFD